MLYYVAKQMWVRLYLSGTLISKKHVDKYIRFNGWMHSNSVKNETTESTEGIV